MGGNAIQNAIRLDRDEFNVYTNDVLNKLKTIFTWQRFSPTTYYKNKQSFGDLDIIIEKPICSLDIIRDAFQSKEEHKNSDIISFEYKQFQIDLIFVDPRFYETSLFYFSYNDLNNLVGRLAHKFGLKFGWDGLWFPLRTIQSGFEHIPDKFLISTDPRAIYDFLDLDYDEYLNGFDDLEDIFKFVISSKYFNADIFDYVNMNHINRLRNGKRKTFSEFIKWLNVNKISNRFEFNPDKSIYMPLITEAFKYVNFDSHIEEFRQREKRKVDVRSKFNGEIVMKIKNIQGETLGRFIKAFKSSKQNFDEWALSTEQKIINEDIKEFNNYA